MESQSIHEQRVARYLDALKPGVKGIDVAASLGVHLATVHNSARKIGKILPRPLSEAQMRYRLIADYYAANTCLTQSDVARHFDVSHQVVWLALQATGTPSRRGRK